MRRIKNRLRGKDGGGAAKKSGSPAAAAAAPSKKPEASSNIAAAATPRPSVPKVPSSMNARTASPPPSPPSAARSLPSNSTRSSSRRSLNVGSLAVEKPSNKDQPSPDLVASIKKQASMKFTAFRTGQHPAGSSGRKSAAADDDAALRTQDYEEEEKRPETNMERVSSLRRSVPNSMVSSPYKEETQRHAAAVKRISSSRRSMPDDSPDKPDGAVVPTMTRTATSKSSIPDQDVAAEAPSVASTQKKSNRSSSHHRRKEGGRSSSSTRKQHSKKSLQSEDGEEKKKKRKKKKKKSSEAQQEDDDKKKKRTKKKKSMEKTREEEEEKKMDGLTPAEFPSAAAERRQSSSRLVVMNTEFETEADETLMQLRLEYCLDLPLNKRDGVMVMQGWNKMLAFKTAFEEALLCKWRILVAKDELLEIKLAAAENKDGDEGNANDTDNLEKLAKESHHEAIDLVENCNDPIAECFGTRLCHMEELLSGMLDGAVRKLCPHTQVVAREAYRPINDDRLLSNESGQNEANTMHLECNSLQDYFHLFAQCGVRPRHWVLFCDAFLWAMQTHVFYADEHDEEELEKPKREGAFAKFVAGQVATPAIQAAVQLRKDMSKDIFTVGIHRFWRRIAQGDGNKAQIGETFYRNLLTNYPDLLDYFAKADMDSLALHLILALDLCVESIPKIGQSRTAFRKVLDHLGEHHLKLGIPTYSYALVGSQLLDTLKPFFEQEEKMTKNSDYPVTAKALDQAFGTLYAEIMSFTYHPMLVQERIYAQAEDFFEKVAEELNWSPGQLSKRLFAVKLEISSTGTYAHTSEELEIGARLAWRNSAKCVGRIAWNTLMVRDRRYMDKPQDIFEDVVEHLKIATGGTNIQSVMTVYKPKNNQTWGVRFWSSQFVRYAYYEEEGLGDPANKHMTEYLIRRKLWTPPEPKTGFDILPLVLKIPGEHTPYVFQLPAESIHEVAIEHPQCPEIASLGLRWGTVPAISNFNMNLGGVDYQCMPFNGWFLSTEVVRNLLERYKVGPRWGELMGMDTSEDMFEQKVALEVDTAVLYSFRKHMYTVVDPVSCGKSFLTHVVRERESYGRECPGQWSWIGGFLGHTNVTWHHEMRDFWVAPQYEYCAESLLLMDDFTAGHDMGHQVSRGAKDESVEQESSVVKVLIAYGSETGNAEAVAMRLARSLRVLKPIVKCLNDVAGLSIIAEKGITHMLVLCSTFGKGSPPQNAELFFFKDIPPGTLSNTHVAVLALGSTLYPDYCRAGVQLEQKLEKAGRKRLVPLEKADSATGAEGTMSDWCALVKGLVLPPHLEAELTAKLASGATSVIENRVNWLNEEEESPSTAQVFRWKEDESCACIVNDELLEDGDVASRSTRRIVFQLPEGTTYETGDHLCVEPLNDLIKVKRFARCFRHELISAATASGSCPFIDDSHQDKESEDFIVHWQLRQPFTVECIEDGAASQATLSFKTPATLWDVLQAHIDLTLQHSLVPDLVAMLSSRLEMAMKDSKDVAEVCSEDPDFLKYCSLTDPIRKSGAEEKEDAINALTDQYPTIVEFFEKFGSLFLHPSLKGDPLVPLGEVLAIMQRLQPRYYSISSSSRTSPRQVAISVGVVHVTTSAGAKIDGVCSNYLARLRPGVDRARISVKESTFRAPHDVNVPMIMIGPGTGLAPMMGFIEDRAVSMEKAELTEDEIKELECHLFFGCRRDADRIYRDEIQAYDDNGVVQFHLALSRAPDTPKAYVQDRMNDMGKELCELLLDKSTHYFICGDARMADQCYEVCVEILRKHNCMSRVAAVHHLKQMRAQERWQFDLWGIVHQFQESRDAVAKMKRKAAKVWLSRFVDDE